jgi:hypothetical protein
MFLSSRFSLAFPFHPRPSWPRKPRKWSVNGLSRLKSIHRGVPGATPAAPSAVDEMLPAGKLFTLGLQHVLVMYAGAIAVPLIVGRALKLPPEQVAALISADLFCCGLVTLIQSRESASISASACPS